MTIFDKKQGFLTKITWKFLTTGPRRLKYGLKLCQETFDDR